MKATLSIRLLLMIMLTGMGAGAAVTAQAQEAGAPAATATATAKKASAPAGKVKPAKKKPLPTQRTTTRKVAPVNLKRRAPIAAKSVPASEALQTTLPPAKLDLSLPQDMVKHLEPAGTVPLSKSRPLLPPLFVEKNPEQTPFQLNGRLLKNEMDLQLRNENHKDIDGAALDFQFKQ